jgi:hypothetical protein
VRVYSFPTYPISSVYVREGYIHLCRSQCGHAGCIPLRHQQYIRAGCILDLRTMFLNAGMPDCTASRQSGTGMNLTGDAGSSPVPESGAGLRCRMPADAGGTGFDADANLS